MRSLALVLVFALSVEAQNTRAKRIEYVSDDLKIAAWLLVPPGEGKLPCVILNRGGNREFSAWSDDNASPSLGNIAKWGYVVIASQYRGGPGSEGNDEFGGGDVNDVLNLIPLLEKEPRCDATRLGMIGFSRGGMMTYLALTRTDRIAAAIVDSGIADLVAMKDERAEMVALFLELIPDYDEKVDAPLVERSAVRFAEKLHKKTPILLLHGTADWRTPAATHALGMASALLAAKHPFRLVLYEGGSHILPEHREDANRTMREWLDRYVRDRKPWPSLTPHGQ